MADYRNATERQWSLTRVELRHLLSQLRLRLRLSQAERNGLGWSTHQASKKKGGRKMWLDVMVQTCQKENPEGIKIITVPKHSSDYLSWSDLHPDTLFWHGFRHRKSEHVSSDTILSGYLGSILTYLLAYTVSFKSFMLTFFLAFYLAFYLACVRVQAWPITSRAGDSEWVGVGAHLC